MYSSSPSPRQVPALLRGTPELSDSQRRQGETEGLAKVGNNFWGMASHFISLSRLWETATPIHVLFDNLPLSRWLPPAKFLGQVTFLATVVKVSFRTVNYLQPLATGPCSESQGGKIRPAILQNPGMDTFCPTEPVCPRKDTLILLCTLAIKLGQNVLMW